jgi:hypothetical protein
MGVFLGVIVITQILCSSISVAADQFLISVKKTQAMYEIDVVGEILQGDTVASLAGTQHAPDKMYILMLAIQVNNPTKKETSLKLKDFSIVSGEQKFTPSSYSEKEGETPIATKRNVQFALPAGGKKTLVLYFPAYREKATALLTLIGAKAVSLNRPSLPKDSKESTEIKALSENLLAGDKNAARHLVSMLGQGNPVVRKQAYDALAKAGTASFEALTAGLLGDNYVIKDQCADLLAETGDLRALKALTNAINSETIPTRRSNLYGSVLSLYKKFGTPALQLLIEGLKDKDPNVRASVAGALGRAKVSEALAALRNSSQIEKNSNVKQDMDEAIQRLVK